MTNAGRSDTFRFDPH